MQHAYSINFHQNQSGAALITALIFLVILTMLALTSMNTNTLEERMAANSQEVNRAFQAAESGLEMVLSDDDAFNTTNMQALDGTINDTYDIPDVSLGNYGGSVKYNAIYRGQTNPPRGSGWDTTMSFYHFDFSSAGSTSSGATTTLHAGAYQVGRKI